MEWRSSAAPKRHPPGFFDLCIPTLANKPPGSKDIAECYLRAQECADLAKGQVDPRARQDFLDMERRWLFLARSYELTERLERFPKPARRWK